MPSTAAIRLTILDTIAELKINRFTEQGNEMVYILVKRDAFF